MLRKFQFFDREDINAEEAGFRVSGQPMTWDLLYPCFLASLPKLCFVSIVISIRFLSPEGLQDFKPTCSTSGRGNFILGDGNGFIRIYDRDYKWKQFQAHQLTVKSVYQVSKGAFPSPISQLS
jgi:hypothetical protein